MSSSRSNSFLSKAESESEDEITEQFVWLQTASGDMVVLETELVWQSPMICEVLALGVGSTRSNPIRLPPNVAAEALELLRDHMRFYQVPGRSEQECELFDDEFLRKDTHILCMLFHAAKFLRLEVLLDMIFRAIARNIENSCPEVKQEIFNSHEKSKEEEELEPRKNPNVDLRIRLSNKLLEKQKKKLEEVENVKKEEAEVEAQKLDDRSIDDLISFINGGDGDTKGVQTLKKKKKNRNKGKGKKATSSSSACSFTGASASEKVIENRDEDINAFQSAIHNGSTAETSKLLGTRYESFNVGGDAVDDELDPVLLEKIDREVEKFALLLKLEKADYTVTKAEFFQLQMELYQLRGLYNHCMIGHNFYMTRPPWMAYE